MRFLIFGFIFTFLLNAHSFSQTENYQQSIQDWHQKRISNLKKENGWLNLAGLFLLQQGKNTFGTSTKNNIIFPSGKCAKNMGDFLLQDSVVSININKRNTVYKDNLQVKQSIIYTSEMENSVVLTHKSLRWFVIKRGKDFYIRLRDVESDLVKKFQGIPRFSVDEKWKTDAVLDTTKKIDIEITDVLGNTIIEKSAGILTFVLDDLIYELHALDDGDNLFLLFSDKSNETSTYNTGRFLYVNKPNKEGNTIIDFNKAINPPCAFTNFATCPLPPKQNALPIAIEAGEKRIGKH